MDKLGTTTEEIKTPEQYFIDKLGEKSEDFLMLKKLVEETNGRISWEKLKRYTKIEDGKVKLIYWRGNLDLRGTSITSLGKLNKIKGKLDLYNVSSLENIGELEEVGGNLDLRGTKIISLGKLKEVGGSLYLFGTDMDLQIDTMKKIEKGILKVDGGGYYNEEPIIKYIMHLTLGKTSEGFLMLERLVKETNGIISWENLKEYTKIENGKIEGIYRLWYLNLNGTSITSLGKIKKVDGNLDLKNTSILENIGELKEVGGDLDVRGANVELQLEVVRKIEKGELTVKGDVHYDSSFRYLKEMIENRILDKEMILNYKLFEEKYGIKVKEIEDEKIKGQVKSFLMLYLEILRIDTITKIIEVLKQIDNTNKKEKTEKIKKIYTEYNISKKKIEGYLK